MKILITGANGFIGSHLVKKLSQDKDNEIYCLVRQSSDVSSLNDLVVNIIYGDITDESTLKNLPIVDQVFHLAGKLGQVGVGDNFYWQLHLTGTKNLVEAINKDNLKRFFFFSSPSVAGPNVDSVAWRETANYSPSNIYEETKAEAEKFLLSVNIPLTIIRPEFVYGPGDKQVLQLIKAIGERKFVVLGSGNNLLQPTYIDDIIDGVLAISKSNKTIGQIYHLAGKEMISVNDLVKTISDILGVKPWPIKIPKSLAYPLAYIMERLFGIFKLTPILTAQRVKFFTLSHTFNTEKIEKDLGYYPKYSVAEGFNKTINWYKNNGWL